MALKKTVSARGSDASYFRLVAYYWDANTREASATFGLYRDKDHSDKCKHGAKIREQAVVEVAAKLRLERAKFDQYLSNDALTNADVLAQLYLAAKTEPVISDFGSDVFSDAQEG